MVIKPINFLLHEVYTYIGSSLKQLFAVTRLTPSKCYLPQNILWLFLRINFLILILDIFSLFLLSCQQIIENFVWLFDLILKSHQQFFSQTGTGLPGLNQY